MTILIALIAASAAPLVLAGGTQRTISDEGKCHLAVPASWKTRSPIGFIAFSPDKSAEAAISTDNDSTLAKEMQDSQAHDTVLKVLENTPRRLWLHVAKDVRPGVTEWFVAVPGEGGSVCTGNIFFTKPAQAAIAKQIVLSVRPVH